MKLTQHKIKDFQNTVLGYYQKHKRNHLPWRKTRDPYKILVSELMLQQTQVDRVIPKFNDFITRFPTPYELSKARLKTVLQMWQGLGYNNRAKRLHDLSKIVVQEYNGNLPTTIEQLEALPGIGPYTARAIMAFAYNKPVTFIETNIRSVYIHHFFHDEYDIDDAQLFPLIEQTLHKNTKEWYAALMDYGTYIKKTYPNPSRKSKHHQKQSRFEGSFRQKRAQIIKLLTSHSSLSFQELLSQTEYSPDVLHEVLESLLKDTMIKQQQKRFRI